MSDISVADHSDTNKTIAVIGAGIAGLTAALKLAQDGAEVHIFERAEELSEVGASLQLSPNATHILTELGLLDRLRESWEEPDTIRLTDADSLKLIAEIPVSRLSQEAWQAPYASIRRSNLQAILFDAVEAHGNCHLYFSAELNFDGYSRLMKDLMVRIGKKPSLVIGADGVWSQTRKMMPLTGDVKFTGNVAWRFYIDKDIRALLPAGIEQDNSVHVLMTDNAHTVLYPADRDGRTNIVFIISGAEKGADEPDLDLILNDIHIHDSVAQILTKADGVGYWPLFEVSSGTWSNGNDIALIGDAAHAMVPFSAQGAAMAIEDACVLSSALKKNPHNQTKALRHYEERRKKRIKRVKKRTNLNRFAYHAAGPVRLMRNLFLSARSSDSLGRDLNWLYNWRCADE